MQVGQEEVLQGGNPRGAKTSPLMPRKGKEASPQAEMQASEVFVRLLCQFEPEAVLPFLQSHETYRVQVCSEYFFPFSDLHLLSIYFRFASSRVFCACLHVTRSRGKNSF